MKAISAKEAWSRGVGADKNSISAALDEIASLLELSGGNPFKVRAYRNAARAVTALQGDLGGMIADGGLRKVGWIGEHIAARIAEMHASGRIGYLEELKSSVPPGLLEMMRIPGLGPKRIRLIHEKLGVSTAGELEYACLENRLLLLDGFGEKLQKKVLDGIGALKKYLGRHLWVEGAAAAAEVEKFLASIRGIGMTAVAGSVRRRRETVKDVDVLAVVPEKTRSAVAGALAGAPFVESMTGSGETKISFVTSSGMACDVRMVTREQFPYALHHFTGSREHNTAMRHRSVRMGLKMNEYGLFRGDTLLKCGSEEDLFAALGLAFIPPELRENLGEIEAAEKGALPRLVGDSDLKGVLHVHTTWSDGRNTLEETTRAAKRMGFSYIGITDHSRTAAYAGGLKADRIAAQQKEIRALEDRLGMRILSGIESDILPDGSLDYDARVLDSFDFVIGSIHAAFNMPMEAMTARVVKAMRDPHMSILGHPTGRLLLAREPYEIDIEAVMAEAARLGVCIELNANPHRLDLDWTHIREAKRLGIPISINPDAHDIEGLSDMFIGVGIARKGWLEKEDVLNAHDADNALKIMRRA
jgi:DNA polymerase (family 10)